MGMSKINVWITSAGNPCEITKDLFLVEVLHCNGKILEWCGKTYAYLPTKCGHIELEVPPGCYIIRAAQWINPKNPYQGNCVTHYGVINASCEHTYCVTLYYPGLHLCWSMFNFALNNMVTEKVFPAEVIKAMETIKKELDKLPMTGFEKEHITRNDELIKNLREKTK